MEQIVSMSDGNQEIDRHLTKNAKEIIKALARHGKMNKWSLQKRTSLRYPRVFEAVTKLEKNGWLEKVAERKSKNKLPSTIYGLTFKGAIAYLSLEGLERPLGYGMAGESKEEFMKQYLASRTRYVERLEELRNFLKSAIESLDYQIFNQIDWLLGNYGILVLHVVVELAKNQIANPPRFFKAIEKGQRMEERQLLQTIEMMKKNPSLRKMVRSCDDGKGNRETEEMDFLRIEESKLEQLRREMELSIKNENEHWKKLFSYNFFERLSYLRKTTNNRNELLAKMVKELLEERKNSLAPLERIVEKLEGGISHE